jgi:integrase/recombinase XerD
VDREVPISQKLVETLREYWRWMRPQTYMFPGTIDNWRATSPLLPR